MSTESDDYTVALDNSTFAQIILILSLWFLYSLLFAYTMTKWKVLRQRPEILVATILLYALCTGQALLGLPALIQLIRASNGINNIYMLYLDTPPQAFAFGLLGALGNMVGDLTIIYRLWIVMGDSKLKNWIVIPVATSVLGATACIFNNSDAFQQIPSLNLIESSLLLSVFLPLCTNVMATAGLSYYIWKESRHEFVPSKRNQARLRRVAFGLIETGFIYFAAQLSYTVIIVVTWWNTSASIDILWVYSITNALNTVIPGVAPTLITAKINITNIIGSRKELITEVFAPWRSESGVRDISVNDGREMTLSGFRAVPYHAGATHSRVESSTFGSEANDVGATDGIKDVEMKGNSC